MDGHPCVVESSRLHDNSEALVPAAREWTRSVRAAVDSDVDVWKLFHLSAHVPKFDKTIADQLSRAARLGRDFIVLSGDRGDAAIATGLAVATCASSMANGSTSCHEFLQRLNKTVVVTTHDRAHIVGAMIRSVFGRELVFPVMVGGPPTELYSTGHGQFSKMHPNAAGMVVDLQTAIWMINEGYTGSFVVDDMEGEMGKSSQMDEFKNVIESRMRAIVIKGQAYVHMNRRFGRVIVLCDKSTPRWEMFNERLTKAGVQNVSLRNTLFSTAVLFHNGKTVDCNQTTARRAPAHNSNAVPPTLVRVINIPPMPLDLPRYGETHSNGFYIVKRPLSLSDSDHTDSNLSVDDTH